MKQLHPIQLQILKKLLFAQTLKFTELKPEQEIENNLFDFHLDQIIKAEYVQKTESGYLLTSIGKEYANRMDTDKTIIAQQAKISVVICPVKIVGRRREYLIYTRLKQPFYGCQGFLSGKVMLGEKVTETAKREFKEETNLKGEPKIVSIRHYRVWDKKTKQLLEDKFMFFCLIVNPIGKLETNNEGRYEWVAEDNLFTYVTNHFFSLDDFKEDIEETKTFDGQISFREIDHISCKF